MPAKVNRTSVFISYSHADSQWLQLLNTHLKPLVRDQKLEIWSDKDIRKGERWRDRIRRQMAKARVGIFLVSADFLASDFIHAEELPPLLKAADQEGAILLTIIVRPCGGAFQDSPLSQLQGMNGPQMPLSGMTRTQREQVMVDVYNELRSLFKTTVVVLSTKAKQSAFPKAPKRVTVAKATSKPKTNTKSAAKDKAAQPKPSVKAAPKSTSKSVTKPAKATQKAPAKKAVPRAKK